MKTWQVELDGKTHIITLDGGKTPPMLVVDDKPKPVTLKLTKMGQAYDFSLHKHTGTIQQIETDKGMRYGLLIDGKPIRPPKKLDVKMTTTPSSSSVLPKYDSAGIFRRKQLNKEQSIHQKSTIRQIIPDWTWVSIIGILFIPAFSQLQPASIIIAGVGIVGVIIISNIRQMKDGHRFAFTIMIMVLCWSAFVIMASRGIIKIANIPLF
ncbi:MAG: hypothetical protein SH821_08560 [Phototrophicales bacterium]|nr:hypothetical protein [Phototrophicales bacterium]